MTYDELYTMYEGYNKRQRKRINEIKCQAWLTAYWQLIKPEYFPSLKSVLEDINNPKKKEQTAEEMLIICKALVAGFGGEIKYA